MTLIVIAAIISLLLPLGAWLIVTSATPRAGEHHAAASGLLALLVATAAFAAFGFALVFGNIGRLASGVAGTPSSFSSLHAGLSLPLATSQPWSLLGWRGFFLQGVPFAGLSLFLPALALAQTCAVLVNRAIAPRSHAPTQALFAALCGGVAFGVAGHWILGGGWLAMLGQNLGFGHGTVDVGGLATVGLIAGAFALAFTCIPTPISSAVGVGNLPLDREDGHTAFPFRAVVGIIFCLIGATAIVAGNPLLGPQPDRVASSFAVNLLTAGCAAGLFALVYTWFTSAQHKTNVVAAAQAMLAACIAISSAGGLLPIGVAVLLGLACGLIVTVGADWLRLRTPAHSSQQTQQRTHIDGATIELLTVVFAPAVLSFVATGLFANGAIGAGWNGIGAKVYLGVGQLGVSGLLPVREGVSDVGQLTAQLCGALAVTLFAGGLASVVLRVLRVTWVTERPSEPASEREVVRNSARHSAPEAAHEAATNTAPQPTRRPSRPSIWALPAEPASAVDPASTPNPLTLKAASPSSQRMPLLNAFDQTKSSQPVQVVDTIDVVERVEPISLPEPAQTLEALRESSRVEDLLASNRIVDAAANSSVTSDADVEDAQEDVQEAPSTTDVPTPNRPPRAKPFVVELAEEQPAELSLVERMRNLRRSRLPTQPVRARKIAYPTRVAGRRLIRPMVDDNTSKSP